MRKYVINLPKYVSEEYSNLIEIESTLSIISFRRESKNFIKTRNHRANRRLRGTVLGTIESVRCLLERLS